MSEPTASRDQADEIATLRQEVAERDAKLAAMRGAKGICGNTVAGLVADMWHVCDLMAGHEGWHGCATTGGSRTSWEERHRLRARAVDAERERDELQQLFDLQWSRMQTAAEMWRQEAPLSRDGVMPDLGKLLDWLMGRVGEERERANEAARLSADARDRADDKDGVIAELREQLSIVEGDRTSRDAWTVAVCHRHGLNLDQDVFAAIGRHLDAVTRDRDAARAELTNERAAHAKTCSNFEECVKAWVETWAEERNRLLAEQVSGEGGHVRTPSPASGGEAEPLLSTRVRTEEATDADA